MICVFVQVIFFMQCENTKACTTDNIYMWIIKTRSQNLCIIIRYIIPQKIVYIQLCTQTVLIKDDKYNKIVYWQSASIEIYFPISKKNCWYLFPMLWLVYYCISWLFITIGTKVIIFELLLIVDITFSILSDEEAS